MTGEKELFPGGPVPVDEMFYRNPAPGAAAPTTPSGKFGTFVVRPTMFRSPIEQHIDGIRGEYDKLYIHSHDTMHEILNLKKEIADLRKELEDIKVLRDEAVARLEKIREHLP